MSDELRPSGVTLMAPIRDALPFVYATNVNVSIRPEEVYFQFGLVKPGLGDIVEPQVTVCVSVAHAKRIMLALERTIAEHERMFGTIHADPADLLTAEGRRDLGLEPNE